MKKIAFLLYLMILLVAVPVQATTVYSELDYLVSGADMAGMQVSATIDETQSSADWVANGTISGAAKTNDWKLEFTGSDTWNYANSWELTSTSKITQLVINAAAGNIFFDIFDTYKNPFDLSTGFFTETRYPDTTGSNRGWWQDIKDSGPETSYNPLTASSYSGVDLLTSGSLSGYRWTFSDPVKLDGSAQGGDLFGILTIDFNKDFWDNTETFSFQADTDTVVPEPSTLMLLAFGLLGAAGIGRKKTIRHTLP